MTEYQAVYQDGVFVPLESVQLENGTVVTVQLPNELSREELRARMIEAGVLEEDSGEANLYTTVLSQEEIFAIGLKLVGDKTILDLVNEEREERF